MLLAHLTSLRMSSFAPFFAGVAALLHVAFFYLESVMFPRSARAQKIFLGKKAEDQVLVKNIEPFLFNQGTTLQVLQKCCTHL